MGVVRLNDLKSAMISGVWGNSNYDDAKNSRDEILKKIDSFYENAVNSIYGDSGEAEIDPNDPFFAAMKRPPQLEIKADSIEGLKGLDG